MTTDLQVLALGTGIAYALLAFYAGWLAWRLERLERRLARR